MSNTSSITRHIMSIMFTNNKSLKSNCIVYNILISNFLISFTVTFGSLFISMTFSMENKPISSNLYAINKHTMDINCIF